METGCHRTLVCMAALDMHRPILTAQEHEWGETVRRELREVILVVPAQGRFECITEYLRHSNALLHMRGEFNPWLNQWDWSSPQWNRFRCAGRKLKANQMRFGLGWVQNRKHVELKMRRGQPFEASAAPLATAVAETPLAYSQIESSHRGLGTWPQSDPDWAKPRALSFGLNASPPEDRSRAILPHWYDIAAGL